MSKRSEQARHSLKGLDVLDKYLSVSVADQVIITEERLRLMRIIAEDELGWTEPADPYMYAASIESDSK